MPPGRVDGRHRLECTPMKLLFLDESGDHNLSLIDPEYPLFVLGGIIVDRDYAEGSLQKALDTFKRDMFGTAEIVLHTADITRNRNGFEKLADPAFREAFYLRLNGLMTDLEYSVIACVIRKDAHLSQYGVAALDPYLLSLDILVERFCFEVGAGAKGIIVAERRDPILDGQLELAWLNLKMQGTRYLTASQIANRVQSLHLRAKKDNIAGLQVADLVVSPIGRHVLGKSDKEDWAVVERKFRRDRQGRYQGYGLVVLPH